MGYQDEPQHFLLFFLEIHPTKTTYFPLFLTFISIVIIA
jgi:hypothetical protein